MEMMRLSLAFPCEEAIATKIVSAARGLTWLPYRSLVSSRQLLTLPISASGTGKSLGFRVAKEFKASPPSPFARSKMYCSKQSSQETGGGATQLKDREIMVQHLLVKEDKLQLLTGLQKKLAQEDVDLSDLAAEHSVCPSKKNGGMLGWVSKGQMVPEFEEAAFSAPLNTIVRVKTKFGWHLLQVLSEREAGFLVEIPPEELANKMQDPEFSEKSQLIDVREPNEIKVASLNGFKPFPLSQFGEWGPTITDALDPHKDTYVMCHHGVRSLQAANWLKTQGFKRLHNVSGGIHAYSTRVDDTIPVY